MNASELVSFFDEELRKIDRQHINGETGMEPQFPMVIVFMGEKAMEGFSEIHGRLMRIWPQFREELCFLGIKTVAATSEYYRLTVRDNHEERKKIEIDELGEEISKMFSLEYHYPSRDQLLLYYILNTTGFSKAEEFTRWTEEIKTLKLNCGVDSSAALEMMILLLNDSMGKHHKVASETKNLLADYYKESGKDEAIPVVLLSNKRSDHIVLADWRLPYRIASVIIALTNNTSTQITGKMFRAGIYTASYEFVEKPTLQIAQVSVVEILDWLSKNKTVKVSSSQPGEAWKSKLKERWEDILKLPEMEDFIYRQIPTEEILELFPRKAPEVYRDLAFRTESEFNELTMNAWSAYLDKIAETTLEEFQADSQTRLRLEREYGERVFDTFTVDELIWAKENTEEVETVLGESIIEPYTNGVVLQTARARLKYLLYSNPLVQTVFLEQVERSGREGEEFRDVLRSLFESKLEIHVVKDDNIKQFYEKKMTSYFDSEGTHMQASFARLSDAEGLRKYFEDMILKIIGSDPVYTSTFEEELAKRLNNEKTEKKDTNRYIRNMLTGTSVPIYFQALFNLGQPILTAMLLKKNTPLYQNLFDTLPSSTFYYDTGCGNEAEAINIYEVDSTNLING